MNFSSLKTKLTFSVIIICLVGMVLVSGVSYFVSRNLMLTGTLDESQQVVIRQAEHIDASLEKQKTVINAVGLNLVSQSDTDLIEKVLVDQYNNNNEALCVYVGFSNDYGIVSNDPLDFSTWKATERDWYIAAMADKSQVAATPPYYDTSLNKMVITLSKYIGQINGLDTVMAIDMDIDAILSQVKTISIGKDGYAFIVDDNNTIIAHPESKFAVTQSSSTTMTDVSSYSEAYQKIQSGAEQVLVKDYDGVFRYIMPYKLSACNWTYYGAISEKVIYEPINSQMYITFLLIALVLIAIILLIQLTVSRMVIKPIKLLSKGADRLANGDLDVKFGTNANDELGTLSNDLAKVVDNLQTVIHDMNEMVSVHETGNFDHMLGDEKYKGAYLLLTQGINRMTGMYIDNFVELLGVLGSFGSGDFEADVRKYPGKQAIGNTIVDDLRSNLKNINVEIKSIAASALNGELSMRIDENKFKGEWQTIFTSLNSVLEAISTPIHEASAVLHEMAQGKLDSKVVGNYKGDFNLIKDNLNFTVDSISSYISEISMVLQCISNDDLTKTIDREYVGEFALIKESINHISVTLSKLMREIIVASEQVNAGAKQVAESSTTLAEGSTEQAGTIEQITEAVNTISGQTMKNAQNAQKANEISTLSMQNAGAGSEEMKHMLVAINEIKESSKNISQIMKVIDDIAFQTNLLALNAAVEAARAGQHGKGFTVVADQVRMLAGRSQEASKQTQTLIEDTIRKIEDGTVIANGTSEALVKIVDNVSSVSEYVSQISEASSSQVDSIAKVSEGLCQISEVVQHNSAIAEESAATSQELSAQSDILSSTLSVFNLK